MQVLAETGVSLNGNHTLPFSFSSALGSCHHVGKIRQKISAVYFLFEQVTLWRTFKLKEEKLPLCQKQQCVVSTCFGLPRRCFKIRCKLAVVCLWASNCLAWLYYSCNCCILIIAQYSCQQFAVCIFNRTICHSFPQVHSDLV